VLLLQLLFNHCVIFNLLTLFIMDWMYDDTILPPQICPSDNTFCQVDMTKKILEDPLVNIKKREIECTQKILKNPMRLKKQQNNKPEKHTIEDHQLDMILVSRLKSYEKAGLDLAKILSITKHKEKKEHKSKHKVDKSSSEDDEKSDNQEKCINRQKKNVTKSNHLEDRKQNDKRSFEYKDYRRNESKNRNERHRSVSSLEDDLDYSKTSKLGNEYGHHRNGNQKYNQSKLKHSSINTDKDTIQSFTYRRNEYHRSSSEDKHKNKYRNNQHTEKNINKKYSNSTNKDENPKYKQLGDNKNREKRHYGYKRHKSSSDRESEEKILNNNTSEHSKYNFKSNEHLRSNSSDRKYEPKVSKESKNSHEYHKKINSRRSRSESPYKQKKYQKTNEIIKNKHKRKSSNSSSSDNEKHHVSVKHTSKLHSTEFQSGSEKHIQHEKSTHKDRKDFGLFVPKSNNSKKSFSPPPVKIQKNTGNVRPKSPPAKKKKLTDEEMEQLRKEMMKDAKIRDKERSSNVKRYRKEDKKEEGKQKPYSKEFLIKTLAHAASQVSVERSIKSNVNKLQKNHSIAD